MQQHQNKHTPKAVPTNLGDFLRQTREQRGISIRQLAASMHLDFGYLSRLEKGVYTKPSPEVLQRIARALDISYEDLFAFTGYQLPQGLPNFIPYLRAKWNMSDDDMRRLNDYFMVLKECHGIAERKTILDQEALTEQTNDSP